MWLTALKALSDTTPNKYCPLPKPRKSVNNYFVSPSWKCVQPYNCTKTLLRKKKKKAIDNRSYFFIYVCVHTCLSIRVWVGSLPRLGCPSYILSFYDGPTTCMWLFYFSLVLCRFFDTAWSLSELLCNCCCSWVYESLLCHSSQYQQQRYVTWRDNHVK